MLAISILSCAGAPTEYALREWHAKDGLPSEEVSRICQDAEGYLWLATSGGLVRFDGTQFLPALSDGHEQRPAPSFSTMTLTSRYGLVVTPYQDGIGAYAAGAYRLLIPADTIAGRRVLGLFTENAETFWAALEDGTLLRHSAGTTQQFEPIAGSLARTRQSFAIDRDGTLWITRGSFLVRFVGGELVPFDLNFGNSTLRVATRRDGGLWIVTRERVHQFDGEKLDAGIPIPPLLGAHYVLDLCEDRSGALWVGTRSKGAHVVIDGHIYAVPATHETIACILEDTNGNIWLGTDGGGLNRLRARTWRLYDTSMGLVGNVSHTVCEDPSGAIWLANRDGGVAKIVGDTVDVLARRPGWPRFSARSVAPDLRGGIWVATGLGIYRIHGDDRLEPKKMRTGADPLVNVMFTARNGDVWFSYDPDTIGRIRGGEQFEFFDASAGFQGRLVSAFGEAPDGVVWAGTTDGRLYRFQGGRFHAVPLPLAPPIAAIRTLFFDPEGVLWAGTTGTGLLVRTRDGAWRRLESEHGLRANNITQILADDHGFLWFGSPSGVFRASRAELMDALGKAAPRVHSVMVGEDSGLPDISCVGSHQPAGWKTSDGRLWFATRRGMLAFDPRPLPGEQKPPRVVIERVRANGSHFQLNAPVELTAGSRMIEIGFSVLALTAPERAQARYRLEGYEEDWTADRGQRVARYSRLPPGDYVFHVEAAGASGQGGGTGARLRLTIHPQWWQTTGFRGAALLALVGVVSVAVRAWSNRRLRRQLEQVEREHAIERERTRIAQNIHDDLGASLTRISLLTQSAHREDATTTANLDEIYDTASEITRALDEIVWAVNPKYDDLESLAGYLGNFAQSFLSVAGIRCRLGMPNEMPAISLTSQMRHNLFLCSKEALNNAVKHALATEVVVSLALDAQKLTIVIADNGCGFHEGTRVAAKGNRTASGNGLINLRRRLAEMKGTCEIGPTPGGGTTVSFILPLPHSES